MQYVMVWRMLGGTDPGASDVLVRFDAELINKPADLTSWMGFHGTWSDGLSGETCTVVLKDGGNGSLHLEFGSDKRMYLLDCPSLVFAGAKIALLPLEQVRNPVAFHVDRTEYVVERIEPVGALSPRHR